MPLQNFVDNSLPTIKAAWLNAVDAFYYTLFNQATTAAQARTALGSTTVGDAVFIAASQAAAQSALGLTGGAVAEGVIYENALVITTNYTLTTGKNAHSVGPITINGGAAVTIPTGARWIIF